MKYILALMVFISCTNRETGPTDIGKHLEDSIIIEDAGLYSDSDVLVLGGGGYFFEAKTQIQHTNTPMLKTKRRPGNVRDSLYSTSWGVSIHSPTSKIIIDTPILLEAGWRLPTIDTILVEYDTVKVIMLVSDTATLTFEKFDDNTTFVLLVEKQKWVAFPNSVRQIIGYRIIEAKVWGSKRYYIDENKQPLPSSVIVWMEREIK